MVFWKYGIKLIPFFEFYTSGFYATPSMAKRRCHKFAASILTISSSSKAVLSSGSPGHTLHKSCDKGEGEMNLCGEREEEHSDFPI